jgi:malate dehydrogenase (oxaloacetate-decarboxylating)(NADP+)
VVKLLRNPAVTKGSAFSAEERTNLRLRGLLPPRIESLQEQSNRCLYQFHSFTASIDKYVFLNSLKERNETLFYYLLSHNLELLMPFIYTPTVGEACIKFSREFRVAQGMYFCAEDKGHMADMVENWPNPQVDIIVVTDGSRILGLGDLGANGMGIPIGKLSLYVAGAGFHPQRTLPVQLDFGTNNRELLSDPFYLGQRHARLLDAEYYPLVDEFVWAVRKRWPNVVLQFEDFSNDHCFDLLEKYRHRCLCFNDDIQGTGAVILAGFISAVRALGKPLKSHRLVFLGAGSAGIGVADAIVSLFVEEEKLSLEEARKHFWFVDSKGLVTTTRGDELASHKKNYARQDSKRELKSLLEVVAEIKPTTLIGLSGQARSFTQDVLTELARHVERPIVFALSNPTSQAECTHEQAIEWTDGRGIFAAGSPFPPVTYKGKTYLPGQGNNMYIFPGLGLGALVARAKEVSEEMINTSAKALALCVTDEDRANGKLYPSLCNIREISTRIAVAVANKAFEQGLAQIPRPANLEETVRNFQYVPEYRALPAAL